VRCCSRNTVELFGVEEVAVGKEASDRTETISDSVRRTDVDVETVEDEETTDFDRQREARTSR